MTAYLIGLTGQLGSGKSTVGRLLGELGATVVDADDLTRDVMRPGQPAFGAIHGAFGGRDILAEDGTIDRAKLAQKVFGDPHSLRRLERIVWPQVIARVLDVRAGMFDDSVLVVEAIKLLESPLATIADEIWVTVAPREALLARVVKRGMSDGEARMRLAAQPSEEEFRRRATTVVENSADEKELRRQVEEALRRSQDRVKKRARG